jgi:2-polyprenyl-6-methoxyphenol hydroxylase-like FAD-dependent oxidoreductase
MKLPTHKVDVLVVGAGPVGLSLAAELQRLNASTLIIDRHAAAATTSRACVIHARTLERLEQLGVTERLLSEGLKVPIFRIRDRDRPLITIDFAKIDSKYAFTLMYPQNETEHLLVNTLESFGGTVQRPVELIAFETSDTGVSATLELDGARQIVESRWLVGCDGMHSRVREQAGIPFEGASYQQGFVLADVHMNWPLSREEVTLFYSPAGFMVVAPLPGDHYRIVATDDHAPENPTGDYLQQLLDSRGPEDQPAALRDVIWSSRFFLHHRVTDSPRRGRLLLCGDAAHVHSPAGGQGMNTGIQDAISLAEVLATPGADMDLRLNEWAAARHRVAADVVAMTDRMTRMATMKSPLGQMLRNAAVAIVGHIPTARAAIAHNLAELDA